MLENKSHPKYEQMMARDEEARSRMPLSKAEIEKEYDHLNGFIQQYC